MNLYTVICCYNSSSRIKTTLEYLAKQNLKALSCEVILVYKNCSYETVSVAQKKWQEFNSSSPLKIIEEKRPGLTHASKAGVEAAKGDIVIFCDDDNWLVTNYVLNSFNLLNSYPIIEAAEGQSSAISDSSFPGWWASYKNGYTIGQQTSVSMKTTKRLAVLGIGILPS